MVKFKIRRLVPMDLAYDPYFFVPRFGKTMAELDIDTKETISHRGKALQQLVAKVNK